MVCDDVIVTMTTVYYTGIVEYMRKQSGPSSILLERAEDIKKFINTREISVVAYFHDNHGNNIPSLFRRPF